MLRKDSRNSKSVSVSVIFKKQICPVSECDSLKIYYSNYRITISNYCLSACTPLWRNTVIIKIRGADSASGEGLQSVTWREQKDGQYVSQRADPCRSVQCAEQRDWQATRVDLGWIILNNYFNSQKHKKVFNQLKDNSNYVCHTLQR
jgi:hypothetical protein